MFLELWEERLEKRRKGRREGKSRSRNTRFSFLLSSLLMIIAV
jgi:hypothetical protein